MHSQVHPNYCHVTDLLVVNLRSSLASFTTTYMYLLLIAGKLPIKFLVAKQLPTNTHTHTHTTVVTWVHEMHGYVHPNIKFHGISLFSMTPFHHQAIASYPMIAYTHPVADIIIYLQKFWLLGDCKHTSHIHMYTHTHTHTRTCIYTILIVVNCVHKMHMFESIPINVT